MLHNVFAISLEPGDVIDLGAGNLTASVKDAQTDDDGRVVITYADGAVEVVDHDRRFNLRAA